jgi:ferredoxin
MKALDSASARKLGRFAMEDNRWRVTAFTDNLDLAPADVAVPSSAHRFHRGFLGREAHRVALKSRAAARFAVGGLAFGVDASAKSRSCDGAGEGALDAVDLDDIDSGSNNRHKSKQRINCRAAQGIRRKLAGEARRFYCFGLTRSSGGDSMAKLNTTVNKTKCIASGDCVEMAPGVFQLDVAEKSEVYNQTGAPDSVILAAARACPAKAIIVVDEESGTQLFPPPKK